MIMKSVLLLRWLLCLLLVACMSNNESIDPPLKTIESIDITRYMGKWYEITKYPNRFQQKCISGTSAEYSLRQDGSVQVINRCKTAEGEMAEAIGQALQVGGSTIPKLQVRFAPAWLSFLPMVWGSYWIIDLDPNYSLAAVSEPTRQYLWVLSRTPTVDSVSYQALLKRLETKGFNLAKLEKPVGVQ